MKTLKFNKKSWHYWVATKFGPLGDWKTNTDFCAYVRAVMVGSIWLSMLVVLGMGILYCGFEWVRWVIACLEAGHLLKLAEMSPAMLFMMIIGIVATVALVLGTIWGWVQLQVYMRQRAKVKRSHTNAYVEPPPSFIHQAYLTWKEKTCFKVELND